MAKNNDEKQTNEKSNENIKKTIKTKKKEIKKDLDNEKVLELADSLQRLQAEFENYKKRADRENEDFKRYSKAELIAKLLPILDTFEIALRHTKDHEKFVKGVEMIYAQIFSTLESEGLKPIRAEGKFDPYLHEVMLKVKSDKEDGTILEELQRGYMLNDKVLRYTKVKVSESQENNESKKQ